MSVPFELLSLSKARNYQSWVFGSIRPWVGKRTLELGAGIGNMSQWLPVRERLILTEIDPELLAILKASTEKMSAPQGSAGAVSVQRLDVLQDDLSPYIAENLDTIVSFNVLEHIDNDVGALKALCRILRESRSQEPKRLIIFVPAHAWAYGTMDRTFGHYRRYSKHGLVQLARLVAQDAQVSAKHLNFCGLLGWVLTGRILKRENIGTGAVTLFESLCPVLKLVDFVIHRILRLPLGQSLCVVMEWPKH